jgi:hypothetical protein
MPSAIAWSPRRSHPGKNTIINNSSAARIGSGCIFSPHTTTYNVHMNLTRRSLAKIVAAAAVPAALEPLGAAPQADADEETRSAHDALRNSAEAIAKVEIPMATEPAVHFKA